MITTYEAAQLAAAFLLSVSALFVAFFLKCIAEEAWDRNQLLRESNRAKYLGAKAAAEKELQRKNSIWRNQLANDLQKQMQKEMCK